MARPAPPILDSSPMQFQATCGSSASFLASGSSSLPFAPLPHVEPRVARLRPARRLTLKDLFEITEDRRLTERVNCAVLLKESKACAAPVLEDEKTCEENVTSWSRLGRLFSPLLPGEAGLSGVSAVEYANEQNWSPALACNSDDMVDFGLSHNHGSNAAVQSTPPPRQKGDESEKKDFFVNLGYAIRTLREELPTMFYKELTYDIYREDIVFCDPMNMVCGLDNYKLIFRALRFHGRMFFKALWVDILRVWQPCDNVIMVRWQVRGIPRVPWEAQGIFDGTSEYKLDKQGKIYEHKVDNVALNARPKFKVPSMADLLRVGQCPSTPKPTFFQRAQMVFWVIFPYLLQFTWVRYYLALKGTVVLYQSPHLLELRQ